jgi:hypothetical protein
MKQSMTEFGNLTLRFLLGIRNWELEIFSVPAEIMVLLYQ